MLPQPWSHPVGGMRQYYQGGDTRSMRTLVNFSYDFCSGPHKVRKGNYRIRHRLSVRPFASNNSKSFCRNLMKWHPGIPHGGFRTLIGPFSVYSMVDGSRQRFFPFVGGKKLKIKIYSLTFVGKFVFFSGDFDDILIEILPIW